MASTYFIATTTLMRTFYKIQTLQMYKKQHLLPEDKISLQLSSSVTKWQTISILSITELPNKSLPSAVCLNWVLAKKVPAQTT